MHAIYNSNTNPTLTYMLPEWLGALIKTDTGSVVTILLESMYQWLDLFLLQGSTVILCSYSGENQEVKGDPMYKGDCGWKILQIGSCNSGWK